MQIATRSARLLRSTPKIALAAATGWRYTDVFLTLMSLMSFPMPPILRSACNTWPRSLLAPR
jgi:hypothetical protein